MIDLLPFLSSPIIPSQAVGTARTTVIATMFDMRALPPAVRPSAVDIDVPAPGPGTPGLVVSLAVNGRVIARGRPGEGQGLHLHGAIDPDALLMRNRIEVAAATPACDTAACRAAVTRVRLGGAPRLMLTAADHTPGFAHLAPRYRAGMTIRLDKGVDPRFGTLLHRALAPLAPLKANGAALLILSRRTPAGLPVPLRFDMGSPSLVRADGVMVMTPERLSDLTVVQVLRGGAHPVIWVRPGRVLPEAMDLDGGNVALFGRTGRVLAFATGADDRTLRAVYTDGPGAAQATRAIALRWLALLALWVLGSAGLLYVIRRLPRDLAIDRAPSWAA